MKAAVIKDYATQIEISEVAKPQLQDESVLIQVHAASLNPIDNILRAGYMKAMMPLSFPHVMGYDVSGTVVEVGKNVQSVKIGDNVFARPNQEDAGALAEFARLQESELAIKPDNLSHQDAASVPLAGLTAWQALVSKGHIKSGDKVLIHAGSGGVGTFAIQIAKHFGAFVATTTSAKNAQLVKDLGADGLAEKAGVHFEAFFMSPDGKMLTELGALISDGTIQTVIDSVFPMDQAAAAYDQLATGRAVGKIVVTLP